VPQHVEFSISDPHQLPAEPRTLDPAESPVNRPLLDGDGVLQVLDFGDGNALEQLEVARMPPLLALSSGRLARGLIRIRCAKGPCTFDAIATPLTDDGKVVGSLTFFSAIQ
jgi:hypothetical protein